MSIKTNTRASVRGSLPPLAETCASFKKFSSEETWVAQVFEMLKAVIQRHQGAERKRFYSMREVADFFGVSLSTAHTVFRDLRREGALISVRSSQSMIPARVSRPRFAIRGVVCMPVWLPGFLHLMDWRRLFSVLEEELSRHRFVLEPVFYKYGEESRAEFVDRVLKFNPDYVLWNDPSEGDRMTMESIADAGVHLLIILLVGIKALPGRIYRTSLRRAWRRGLADWKASGEINQVIAVTLGQTEESIALKDLRSIAEASGQPLRLAPYSTGSSLPQYVKHLGAMRHTGIIFADDMLFSRMCALAPEEVFKLFRRHRVMVSRRATLHSGAMPSGVTADWLHFSHRRMARRIAEDLNESKGALLSSEEIFEADWRPHTPLESLIQTDFME